MFLSPFSPREYTRMLADMAGVEDLTHLEAPS